MTFGYVWMHYVLFVIKGGLPFPAKDVISSEKVEPNVQVHCNFLCYQEPKCVGFNFRHTTKAENCQLVNSTKGRTNTGEGDWTMFVNVNAVCVNLFCIYQFANIKLEGKATCCFSKKVRRVTINIFVLKLSLDVSRSCKRFVYL